MGARIVRLIWSMALVLTGVGTLHYINPEDAEHHIEWARSMGLPAPAEWMRILAWALILAGLVLPYFMARRRRRSQ